jgi:hypothetical protein
MDDIVHVELDTMVIVDDPSMTEEDWANLGRFVAELADDVRFYRDHPGEWQRQADAAIQEWRERTS